MSDDLPEEHPVAPDTTDASNRKTDVLPEKPALPKRFYKAVEARCATAFTRCCWMDARRARQRVTHLLLRIRLLRTSW